MSREKGWTSDCYWSLQKLLQHLIQTTTKEKVNLMLQKIKSILYHTLLSCQEIIIANDHSFEIFGYDILIDSNLNPWLLEINNSPSLTPSNDEDFDLKVSLVNDALNVALPFTRNDSATEGDFELLQSEDPLL